MSDRLKPDSDKRHGNELLSKSINEARIGKVTRAKMGASDSAHSRMQFNCECDVVGCQGVIFISIEEYHRVHHEPNFFIVAPKHVRLDIEKVICSFYDYVLVGRQ